ncbi:lysyl-tRNA synthetase, class II [Capronia epimyces CBS 606.96]|uniref:Lysyl-tRNA synthetase, class II n=1 Tax=Capronia epimyces CBS 606.96 TaxID=1182542 RepID=W9YKQ5_9EURO|nr:lysyl-tRNA synthetase, class II [Capronia epimyces CBS 606.96]EXJ89826.1 lysyl-tRNA synthetase, class II [Capronia epimyces CBS 606.96]
MSAYFLEALKGGRPYRAKNGQLSIKASSLPVLQSPCLQRFPVEQRGFATSPLSEVNYHPRHVEMLTDPDIIDTLKARSALIRTLRTFFETRSFVEVNTPILTALAGGATAKPFETTATEFADRKLSLRIAPELWLKRLVVGGMDRIFEIGPSFRNEGLDKTHNPEFTTCEFYAVRHDLPQLMDYTKQLLTDMALAVGAVFHQQKPAVAKLLRAVQEPYQEFDFIPTLSSALELDLPNLSSPDAQGRLLDIFEAKNLPLPSNPTVPRLVDKLSSIYVEPRSAERPAWIVNIPECLSPLAKSYIHPTASHDQPVAARAELFIQGKEVVNCYEEENDPFEQRRKFQEQQRYAHQTAPLGRGDRPARETVDEEAMKVDQDYLEALEWGLPPTGGWGCGIDRLVMLFIGKERIGDVLSFGSLRAVTRGAEKRDSDL